MNEKMEVIPDMDEQIETQEGGKKIENLFQLRDMLTDKFGDNAYFFKSVLNEATGYKTPSGVTVDAGGEETRIEKLLQGTEISQDIIDEINNAPTHLEKSSLIIHKKTYE